MKTNCQEKIPSKIHIPEFISVGKKIIIFKKFKT